MKTKDFTLAPFVYPPAIIVHCSIVIFVPRDWLQTTYSISLFLLISLTVILLCIQKVLIMTFDGPLAQMPIKLIISFYRVLAKRFHKYLILMVFIYEISLHIVTKEIS